MRITADLHHSVETPKNCNRTLSKLIAKCPMCLVLILNHDVITTRNYFTITLVLKEALKCERP